MKKITKIIIIILIVLIIPIIKISTKILINQRFIKNYPGADQEYRLRLISFINLYEPYIAPYNYGNYLYMKGDYQKAYAKYLEALTHNIPKKRYCSVKINTSLSLYSLAKEEKDDTKAIKLLEEAKKHLYQCIMISQNEKYKDDDVIIDPEVEKPDKDGPKPNDPTNPNPNDPKPNDPTDPNPSFPSDKPFGIIDIINKEINDRKDKENTEEECPPGSTDIKCIIKDLPTNPNDPPPPNNPECKNCL